MLFERSDGVDTAVRTNISFYLISDRCMTVLNNKFTIL